MRACGIIFATFLGISVYFIVVLVTPPDEPGSASQSYADIDERSSSGQLSDEELRGFSEYADWFTALQRCNDWDGQLAESGSPAINDAIFEACPTERCWIGATDLEAEGRWVWAASGDLVGSASSGDKGGGWWKPGTPDNGQGHEDEDCMYMYGKLYKETSNRKRWNDKPCGRRLSGFVCQRKTRSSDTGKPSGANTPDIPCRGYASQSQCSVEEGEMAITSSNSGGGGVGEEHRRTLPICKAIQYVVGNATQNSSNSSDTVSFAVIGDFGLVDAGCEIGAVGLMHRLERDIFEGARFDFVASTGDNAYWGGDCKAFNDSVLPFFGEMIPKPQHPCNDAWAGSVASAVPGIADRSHIRFWPTIGNHDWRPAVSKHSLLSPIRDAIPYFQTFPHVARQDALELVRQRQRSVSTTAAAYFNDTTMLTPAASTTATPRHSNNTGGTTLSSITSLLYGGYYRKLFASGLIEMFAVNSNLGNPLEREHMFMSAYQAQIAWLRHGLNTSTAAFRVVVFHHPPFSTARHDPPAAHMRLPFKAWGADLVLSGHQHVYERLEVDGLTYIINGLGGHHWIYEIKDCDTIAAGSRVRYNAAHGVMVGVASETRLAMCFYSLEKNGTLVDEFLLKSQR